MEISVLATREIWLVIIESRSITGVGDLEQITSCKLEVAGTGDVAGMKTGHWLTQAEAQSALRLVWWKVQTLFRQSPSNHQW